MVVTAEARIPDDICQDATGPGALNMTFMAVTSNRAAGTDPVPGDVR